MGRESREETVCKYHFSDPNPKEGQRKGVVYQQFQLCGPQWCYPGYVTTITRRPDTQQQRSSYLSKRESHLKCKIIQHSNATKPQSYILGAVKIGFRDLFMIFAASSNYESYPVHFCEICYLTIAFRRHWRSSHRGHWAGELPAHGTSKDRPESFGSSPGTVLIYCNKDQEEIPHAN